MIFQKVNIVQVRINLKNEEILRQKKARKTAKDVKKEYTVSDNKGKNWGEKSFSAISDRKNGGEGEKWTTDTEAEICADVKVVPGHQFTDTPTKKMMAQEAYAIVLQVATSSEDGQENLQLFLNWLTSSVLEVAQDFGRDAGEVLRIIRGFLLNCRRVSGVSNPELFPFPEELKDLRENGYSI